MITQRAGCRYKQVRHATIHDFMVAVLRRGPTVVGINLHLRHSFTLKQVARAEESRARKEF